MVHFRSKPGALFIVATPIGNLADITYRAVEILCAVDHIAVEDSYHSAALLKHYRINKPVISLHDHNEEKQSEHLINKLLEGQSIALISDAGTPLISDPGYRLVVAAHAAGLGVIPIPGPCAAITALCVAGLPSDRFAFEGFLPSKSMARKTRLQQLTYEQRTLLFYEAPHRILKLVDDMISVFGEERFVVVCREMTKLFEAFYRGSLTEVRQTLLSNAHHQKGEFVVLLQGVSKQPRMDAHSLDVLNLLLSELPVSRAVSLASKMTGARKKDLYLQAHAFENFRS